MPKSNGKKATKSDEMRLSDAQHQAIDFIIAGRSFTDVATELGVHRATLYRWNNEPLFRAALEERRHEVWSGSLDRLRVLVGKACDVITEALEDPKHPDRTRVALEIIKQSGGLSQLTPGAVALPPTAEDIALTHHEAKDRRGSRRMSSSSAMMDDRIDSMLGSIHAGLV